MSADIAFDPGRGISHGIEAVKRIPIQLWLGGAILSFTGSGGSGCSVGDPTQILQLLGEGGGDGGGDTGGGFDFDFQAGLESLNASMLQTDPFGLMAIGGAAIFGMICCALVAGLLMFALKSFVQPGWYRLHEECLRTGGGEFSTLFSGQDLFLKMLLWNLLKGVIVFSATLVCLVPAAGLGVAAVALESVGLGVVAGVVGLSLLCGVTVYLQPGLAFGGEAITFDGLSVMDALARSWDLARGNRIQMIIFFVVLGLVNAAAWVAGMCLCCVGMFVTGPLARGGTDLAATEAYLILTRGPEIADDWALLRPPVPGPVGPTQTSAPTP
jgi:hypothetical protein